MRATSILCLVLALALVSADASARDETAAELIGRMIAALDKLNYEGSFVFVHDQNLEAMNVIHGTGDSGVRERLTALTGEPRELIRLDDNLICLRPSEESSCLEPRKTFQGLPGVMPLRQDNRSLRRHYRMVLGEEERVAGLPCVRVSIVPRDELRYGHRLCIHDSTGMLLHAQLIDPLGQVMEQFMFTQVVFFDELPEERFLPDDSREAFQVLNMKMQQGDADGGLMEADESWTLDRLPRGFALTGVSRRQIPGESHPVQHMVVSDGIASVSIFIARPENPEDLLQGITRSGALHALAVPLDDYQITVLGEVPVATVRMIAESVRHEVAP